MNYQQKLNRLHHLLHYWTINTMTKSEMRAALAELGARCNLIARHNASGLSFDVAVKHDGKTLRIVINV